MSLNHIFDRDTARGDPTQVYSNEVNTFNGLTFDDENLGEQDQGRLSTTVIPDTSGDKNYLFFRNETSEVPLNASLQRLYTNLEDITIPGSNTNLVDLITYNNYAGLPIVRQAGTTRRGSMFQITFSGNITLASSNQSLEISVYLGNIEIVKKTVTLPNQTSTTPFRFNLNQCVREIGPAGTAEIVSFSEFSTIDIQGGSKIFYLDNINDTTYETTSTLNGFVKFRWISNNAGNSITIRCLTGYGNL